MTGTCFVPKGEGGLAQDGVALCFQLRAIDVSRLEHHYGTLSKGMIQDIADAAVNALGID